MQEVSEIKAAYMTPEDAFEDRQLFVENLGVLLSQTREGIVGCSLSRDEIVTVLFEGEAGIEQKVNVNYDSYLAIIRDVVKNL